MDETVKTTSEVTHLHTVDRVVRLHVRRSKTPYIPKIKGNNKLNWFTMEWST